MARAADPGGKRTVGIITKCDALQAGDEQMASLQNIRPGSSLIPSAGFGNSAEHSRTTPSRLVRGP